MEGRGLRGCSETSAQVHKQTSTSRCSQWRALFQNLGGAWEWSEKSQWQHLPLVH